MDPYCKDLSDFAILNDLFPIVSLPIYFANLQPRLPYRLNTDLCKCTRNTGKVCISHDVLDVRIIQRIYHIQQICKWCKTRLKTNSKSSNAV